MRFELLGEQLVAGLHGFLSAELAQVDVVPAGEQVLDVPNALAMTNQYQFSGHVFLRGLSKGSGVHAVELGGQRAFLMDLHLQADAPPSGTLQHLLEFFDLHA